MFRFALLFGMVGLLVSCNVASAAVVHSEFLLDGSGNVPLDGANNPIYTPIPGNELSGEADNPTQINVAVGDNTVYGIIADAFVVTFDNSAFLTGNDYVPGDHNVDIFTFDVGPGQIFDSLTLEYYDNPTDPVIFLAIQNEDTFPINSLELGLYNFNGGPDVYLGGSVVDGRASGDLGQDILPRLGNSGNVPGSFGFSEPLGEGSYTIHMQQTGGSTPYGVTIGISTVPEPSSVFAITALLAGCAVHYRRRRPNRVG